MSEGLSDEAVKEQLKIHGYNELPSVKPKSVWRIAWEVFKEPMFLLLVASAVLYILLGDVTKGVILLSTISIIIFITFFQYQKTEKALEALKKLSSPRALVIRNGSEIRVPGRDIVPGDIILLHEGDRVPADATIQETVNLLVDESMLTGESVPVTKHVQSNAEEQAGLVYSGTLVVQGKARAVVTATAMQTQFGKIGASLQGIVQDTTRLQAEMKLLIRNLFIIGAVLSIGVVLAFYFTRGNFIQSLLNGLSAAMAILPEEFPVVLTVFLALGAWRLSKINVLTRNPSVIETLGSATVLCTDKTGTITQNKMEVMALYDGNEAYDKNSFAEKKNELAPLITAAQHASQKKSVDPMEKAIGKIVEDLALENINGYKLLKEYPLSKELFAMTRVLENESDQSVHVAVKGAPEAVFGLCKLTAADTEKYLNVVNQWARQGYRVIAAANASLPSKTMPEKQSGFAFTFLGLIGLEDPVRPEVLQAVKECKEAGIKVIMITGDYPATAKSIAAQIGLSAEKIITGDELKEMKPEEIREQITAATIFARVVPEQKLIIVQALKENGEIVAMTGDGVNDAPALKAANIGIAMGNKGTDVAREAAALVLLDDNFASIVAAIRSGRRIFDNLQKAMAYIIAIHIPIIGLTLLPAFYTSLPLLLMPLHIVFMELIIDPVCSVAFEYEQEEKGIMQRPPRNAEEKFFGRNKLFRSAMRGVLLLVMVVTVYFLSVNKGYSEGEVRAITFSALILGNIFLILAGLSKTRSFSAVFTERNYPVLIILSLASVMLLVIIAVPYLRHIFSFEFTDYRHFIMPVAGAAAVLLILELVKVFRNWKLGKTKPAVVTEAAQPR